MLSTHQSAFGNRYCINFHRYALSGHNFVADSSRAQNSPLFDAVGAYRQEYVVKYAERSLRCIICSRAKNQNATGFICKDCSSALSKYFLLEPIEQDELHHSLITPLEAQKRYDLTKPDLKFLKERGYASTIVLESEPIQKKKKKKRRRCNPDYGIWDSGPLTYFPELRVVLLALSKNRSQAEDGMLEDPLFGQHPSLCTQATFAGESILRRTECGEEKVIV